MALKLWAEVLVLMSDRDGKLIESSSQLWTPALRKRLASAPPSTDTRWSKGGTRLICREGVRVQISAQGDGRATSRRMDLQLLV